MLHDLAFCAVFLRADLVLRLLRRGIMPRPLGTPTIPVKISPSPLAFTAAAKGKRVRAARSRPYYRPQTYSQQKYGIFKSGKAFGERIFCCDPDHKNTAKDGEPAGGQSGQDDPQL